MIVREDCAASSSSLWRSRQTAQDVNESIVNRDALLQQRPRKHVAVPLGERLKTSKDCSPDEAIVERISYCLTRARSRAAFA